MTVYSGEDVKKGEHSFTAGGSATRTATLEISMAMSQENGNQSTTRSSIPTLRHAYTYPKEVNLYNKGICSTMFIAALLLTART